MKKKLAYVAIAVLLGAALMFAPFWAFPVQMKTDNYTECSPRNFSPENFKAFSTESETAAGIMPHYPIDAISVSLMLVFSLVFALIISSNVKRRMT